MSGVDSDQRLQKALRPRLPGGHARFPPPAVETGCTCLRRHPSRPSAKGLGLFLSPVSVREAQVSRFCSTATGCGGRAAVSTGQRAAPRPAPGRRRCPESRAPRPRRGGRAQRQAGPWSGGAARTGAPRPAPLEAPPRPCLSPGPIRKQLVESEAAPGEVRGRGGPRARSAAKGSGPAGPGRGTFRGAPGGAAHSGGYRGPSLRPGKGAAGPGSVSTRRRVAACPPGGTARGPPRCRGSPRPPTRRMQAGGAAPGEARPRPSAPAAPGTRWERRSA